MAIAKPCTCTVCDVEFVSITKMQEHRKTCALTCPECSKTFKSKKSHTKHVEECQKSHKCTLCPERFKAEHQLIRHNSTAHDISNLWKCEVCSKEFVRRDLMQRHTKEVHNGKKRKAECGTSTCPCGFSSDRKLNWDRHVNKCPAHRQGARTMLHAIFEKSTTHEDQVEKAMSALFLVYSAAVAATANIR